MNKVLRYIYRGLPLFIFLFICLFAFSANASWWDTLKDAALNAAGETAARVLGIDTEDNCTPPSMDSTTCLFCPLFKTIFNASSIVAAKSYKAFSSDLGELVLVFLAVSLALIILRNIATLGSKDPSALVNDIFKKTFVCVAIYIIISKDYYNVLNITLTPIFESGLNFVKTASDNTSCANAGNIIGYSADIGSGSEGGLPMAVGTSIVCAVEDIERKINTLFEFGGWALCLGNGPNRVFHLIPNPIFILDGIFLYIAGIFFMFTYPWIMGDAVLQFGVATAILPFAVCGYAFSGTKSYLSKVFSWLLNSLFVFMFMAILILCILGYIGDLLGAALTNGLADPEIVFSDPNQGIAFYGPNMLKIIFILVIGWAYMPVVADLAEKFAAGSGLSAAGKIGDTVRNTIDAKTRKVADWSVGVAGNAAKTTGRVTKRRVQAGVRQGITAGINTFGNANSSGGKTISFAGMKFQTQRNADGSQVLRREFTSITGRRHVMISDKYSTIKKEYARGSGREIKSEVQFKHGFLQNYLIDESTGKINVGAVQTLLNSPLAQKPEYKKALMSQLAVEIIKKKTGRDIGAYYYARNVQFDPDDPYNLHIEQKDNTGKTTSFGMKIDPATGQVAVQFHRERDRNRFEKFGRSPNGLNNKYNASYETIFDNGLVNISTSGYKTEGDLRKGAAQTVGERTVYKFSEFAQQGHDHFTDKIDGNQIIENDGTIARDLNPAFDGLDGYKGDLLFGLDDLAGIQNINGQNVKDYVRDNILKKGRNKKTNKLNSNFDWTMDSFYVADDNGNIIGRVDSSGAITGKNGVNIGNVSGGIAYDYSGHPIGRVI